MKQVKNALLRFDGALEKYFSHKWHWCVTIPLLVVLITVLYFAFCFKNGTYSADTYGYRDGSCRTWARVLAGMVIGCSLLYLIFEGAFRTITPRKVVWGFLVISSTLLTLWGFQHALNQGHHHDAGAMGSGNHWSIIYDIYANRQIPAVNLRNQYYQPKFYHVIIAGLMIFNSLFIHLGDTSLGTNASQQATYSKYTLSAYHSLELTRVFMILLGIASLYALYRIIKGLGVKGAKLGVITALLVMIPEFWYIQFFMNNDGLALTLSLWALVFALEFKKDGALLPLILTAVFLGCAMMTKLNAALMAVPIAIVFLYVFVTEIRRKEGRNLFLLFSKFILFAAIVFPLGLWTPIYYNLRYNMPFGYVLDLTPTYESKVSYGMYIDPEYYSFWRRLIAFPSEDLFYSPFNHRWRTKIDGQYVNGYGVIDFNCWTAFFKTGFFNEWDDFFKQQGYVATSLLIVGMYLEVFLTLFSLFVGAYYIVRSPLAERYPNGAFLPVMLIVIAVTFGINYMYFVTRYPVGCSQNARYLMPLFIPTQALVGSMLVDVFSGLKRLRAAD